MADEWPLGLPVVQVRVARSTKSLAEVVRFYRDGLGLREIGSFQGHAGYTGVMLGLPDNRYHLEFTEHEAGTENCAAPSKDNLLVFYMPDGEAIERLRLRLRSIGFEPVPPENPYWQEKGLTFEDPDGWRVVLMNTRGI